jgi:putative SOS response-associated peptidase YedK
VLAVKPDENLVFPDNMPSRYNIAPGQNITAIANTDENHAHSFIWGLIQCAQ